MSEFAESGVKLQPAPGQFSLQLHVTELDGRVRTLDLVAGDWAEEPPVDPPAPVADEMNSKRGE